MFSRLRDINIRVKLFDSTSTDGELKWVAPPMGDSSHITVPAISKEEAHRSILFSNFTYLPQRHQ